MSTTSQKIELVNRKPSQLHAVLGALHECLERWTPLARIRQRASLSLTMRAASATKAVSLVCLVGATASGVHATIGCCCEARKDA